MGASREMQFSALAEGAFFAVIGFMIVMTGSLSMSQMLSGFTAGVWSAGGAAVVLVAFAFFLVMLLEACRVPFDDPETHLELTMIHEAMILDYGGPDLAIIFYGAALKMWILASFLVMLVMPALPVAGWLGAVIYFAAVGVTAVLVGIIESVMARFRFLKVPQLINGALCAALIAIIFIMVFGEVAK